MKRFVFSLQRMLAFKRTMYEKERNTLAQMRAARAAIKARRDATERQMLNEDAGFRAKAVRGVTKIQLDAHAFTRASAGRLITRLEGEIAWWDTEVEKQLQVVVELDKEVKSLEKLREHQWDDYQAESLREERERILEIVGGRFAEGQKQARLKAAQGL